MATSTSVNLRPNRSLLNEEASGLVPRLGHLRIALRQSQRGTTYRTWYRNTVPGTAHPFWPAEVTWGLCHRVVLLGPDGLRSVCVSPRSRPARTGTGTGTIPVYTRYLKIELLLL